MKELWKEYKEIVLGCFILLVIVLAIVAGVIFAPSSTPVIVTDTGYTLEYSLGSFLIPDNYEIFEESKTIVITENGEYTSYKYNDWYMFDHIQGKSIWQRWTEK
ncbi:MAG: hypothetical protein IJW55_09440 [Clostridia bacterium]|nr:hypothetical protein [Clostridia bacterium]